MKKLKLYRFTLALALATFSTICGFVGLMIYKQKILFSLKLCEATEENCSRRVNTLKDGDVWDNLKALDELNFSNPIKGTKWGNNLIIEIQGAWDNFHSFLSQLTFEQYGAVVHILSSISILICTFNIMSIIYGNLLLDYLKIEEKYPKLARILKIRRKIQSYSLILNFMYIILILCALLFINFHLFSLGSQP